MEKSKLRVGLIGLGRLGHIYADILATRIPEAQLIAVAGHCAPEIAVKYNVPIQSLDRLEVINNPQVDAIVICSSTDTHVQFVLEAFKTGKPVFCEKPLCTDSREAKQYLVPAQRGSYFQMGFMRRFDPAYVEAKLRLDSGDLGDPFLFRATSRDKQRTSLTYAKTSGGMILDMAIHDLDLARFFMEDDVVQLSTIGGAFVYPELGEIGDIDNAIISLKFPNAVGVIDVSRHACYGYDIATEILCTNGALRIGALNRTSVLQLNDGCIWHDTIPSFMERFDTAFVAQLQNFVGNVVHGKQSPVTLEDGIEALYLAEMALLSLKTHGRYTVEA